MTMMGDLQAIFLMSIRNVVAAWACRKKGPVFVAMFNPLGLVIALGMGVIFLGDTLYMGRYIYPFKELGF